MSAHAIRIPEIQDKQMSFGKVLGRAAKVKIQEFKVAGLFAGVGGIDLAFQNAGFLLNGQMKLIKWLAKHTLRISSTK